MASSRVLSLLFLLHLTAAAAASHLHLWSHSCYISELLDVNYGPKSTFRSNLHNLLTEIPTADLPYGFYNNSFGKDPDAAYATALCRGDIDISSCRACIKFTISRLTALCHAENVAVGCADNCTLMYSSWNMLGQWVMYPSLSLASGSNATNVDHFISVLRALLHSLPSRADSGDSGLKFATGEADVTADQRVYALAQCAPDLPSYSCLGCLYTAIYGLLSLKGVAGRTGARVAYAKCSVRYELHKFYSSPDASTPVSSPARSSKGSVEFSVVVIVVLGVPRCVSVLVNFLCCWLRLKTKANKMIAAELEATDRGATKIFSEANQ